MSKIYVEWTDASATAVLSVFSCPQDPTAYPNQAVIDSSDARYQAFINPMETIAQKVAALLSSGVVITSTGTPALNGTYAADQLSQSDIIAIETSLSAGKGFPGGESTFSYPDLTGAMHTFNEADFTNLAAAVRDFVYGCRAVAAGESTAMPTASAVIA